MSYKKYIKKDMTPVVAIQLNLETEGLDYKKWGDDQHAKQYDWVVSNNEEVYTIDKESFANTYKEISLGLYRKIAPIWAKQADADGGVSTKEGLTHYYKGDYIVSNNEDGSDSYAISQTKFEEMYILAENVD